MLLVGLADISTSARAAALLSNSAAVNPARFTEDIARPLFPTSLAQQPPDCAPDLAAIISFGC
jgi:hypothetical protein